MRVDAGRLVPFNGSAGVSRRQDKPHVVARNGPAIVAVRTPVLEGGSLYGNDCRPLSMTAEESIDIDTPYDFALAEWALARKSAP
jgi:CMP-N-acetylneuraminic acid synthetase